MVWNFKWQHAVRGMAAVAFLAGLASALTPAGLNTELMVASLVAASVPPIKKSE